MAARGSIAKAEITQKILDCFPGSFTYDKEIRVPMTEDGSEVQIKIVLTAAKTNVEHGGDVAIPGAASVAPTQPVVQASATVNTPTEPSQEEKDNIKKLMASLF